MSEHISTNAASDFENQDWGNMFAADTGFGDIDPFAMPDEQSSSVDTVASPMTAEQENRREGLLSKLRRTLGSRATRLAEMVRGRNIGGALEAGGSVSRGIKRAGSAAERLDKVANSRTAKVASHVPVVGKYVKAGREIAGAARNVAEVAGHYDNMAQATADAYDNRVDLAGQAVEAGRDSMKRIMSAGALGALESLGEDTGITLERGPDGKLTADIKKRRLAAAAFKAFRTRGASVAETVREASDVFVEQTRGQIGNERDRAVSGALSVVHDAYSTGEITTPGNGASQEQPGDTGDFTLDWGDWSDQRAA